MGSIYGVAWPMASPIARAAGSNQTCTAGADTTVLTFNNVQAPFPGFYQPVLYASIALTCGATAPSAVLIKAQLNGGAAFFTANLWASLLVNNANIYYPTLIVCALSGSVWFPGPNTITVTVNPTGQNVTYTDGPTFARLFILRGPDA